LARHEGDFRSKARQPLSMNDLLALLGDAAEREGRSREDAIACYLSGDEGWREAVKLLGGAFAEGEARLRERQED
jgi:type IV secretory pathway VirJ component